MSVYVKTQMHFENSKPSKGIWSWAQKRQLCGTVNRLTAAHGCQELLEILAD